MSKKTTPFNPSEVISRAQTELICALLRLLPWDGTPVRVHKMHRFLNPDSYLPDGYVVESVRLVEDGHHVEVTIREVNYEYLDNTIHDVSEVDEDHNTHFLKEETSSFIVKPDAGDHDLLPLLVLVYKQAQKNLEAAKEVRVKSEKELDAWFKDLDQETLSFIFFSLYEEIMMSADPRRCTINHFYKEAKKEWKALPYEEKVKMYKEAHGLNR